MQLKRRLLFYILFTFTSIFCNAQYTGNVWCFGDSAGLNFNSTPLAKNSTETALGSTVSICDSLGNLLIYSYTFYHGVAGNSTLVKNKYGILVQNGSNIVGQADYHELVLLPYPGNDSLLILFSIGVNTSSVNGLYYSIINYKLNNDSGVVIQKNIPLQLDPAFDGLTAIKNGNGKDWFLVFQKWNQNVSVFNNDLFIYLINNQGVALKNHQNIGALHTTSSGDLSFNTTGTKCGYVDWRGLVQLFDFDRCTGIISNPILIEPDRGTSPFPYYTSCVFSTNGNYLYVNSYQSIYNFPCVIYQYDLTSSNIANSKIIIHQFSNLDEAAAGMEMGPDHKIYISASYTGIGTGYPYPYTLHNYVTDNLSVINSPDSLGAACNFQPFSFYLGGRRTYYGLPNNPDYTLGPLVGSPCDTITAVHEIKQPRTQNELKIFYHPQWEIAFINADKLHGKKYTLQVYDITGKEIFKEQGNLQPPYFTKDLGMSGFAKGVYIVTLQTEMEVLSKKFVKY